MADGTVEWFNSEKRYGFISQDDGGPDVFAHYPETQGDGFHELTEGEHVTFGTGRGRKAPQAQNVVRS
ncbi:cold-shock protein [Streptomyces viridosporus]|uniref:cold-shock protein n=1 Tax=Streptomyces viridosporus TaxID=67581 RepID=UPI0009C164E2|nr:cold-shock protein [Streptomyces viridosporus]